MSSGTSRVSFVIPVYRNEKAVSLTYQKIRDVFETTLPQYALEMVFIDDGSDDGSLAELLALRHADPRVKVITFTRNFGQMAAMLAGFKQAGGDCVINISADLQDPVEVIPRMIEAWKHGAEIVIGHRTDRDDSWTAKLFSRIAYGLLRLSIPQIPAGGFDFVLMDRVVLDAFNAIDVRNRFFQGDVLWSGHRTTFIPYVRLKRTIGRSQYTLWKKLKTFIDAMVDASYLPIRFISLVGVLTSFAGAIYSLVIVYGWAVHATPFSGWAPIMMAVLLIGGLIMVMLGVIGEYIWRIYDEVRKKPNYVIRDTYT